MSGRTVDFELGNAVYPLCFTLGAAEAFYARYGSIDGWFDRLKEYSYVEESDPETGEAFVVNEGDSMKLFSEYLWLLETLLSSGAERTVCSGGGPLPPPDMNDLRHLLCVGDIARVRTAVIQTISLGNVREVSAAAPKNGEGAGEE